MKNWGLGQIGFTVVPTLIFDMTKAKATMYLTAFRFIQWNYGSIHKLRKGLLNSIYVIPTNEWILEFNENLHNLSIQN